MYDYFIEAVDLRQHPLIHAKAKTKAKYFIALSYIVHRLIEESENVDTTYGVIQKIEIELLNSLDNVGNLREYIKKRLDIYRNVFFSIPILDSNKNDLEDRQKYLKYFFSKRAHKNYRMYLMCDVALIVLDNNLVKQGAEEIKQFLSKRSGKKIDTLVEELTNKNTTLNNSSKASALLNQYQKNLSFISKKERRIIVTANMSAGKSTLINALIGKSIARTSQEVCTGSPCYIFNKAFEDNNIALDAKNMILNASENELKTYKWGNKISISSYFYCLVEESPRICLIDTPGVNAALNKEHAKFTYSELLKRQYDRIIYVISPTSLGTDAERKYLQWIFQNAPRDKVIFVLNKLDNYRSCSDSIDDSIKGLRNDLEEIGFENPVICPISAYFSLLIKLKMTGQVLSEDENDEYTFFMKKFNRSSYDLSRFYEGSEVLDSDSEEVMLTKRTGLYGLEQLIYGGES